LVKMHKVVAILGSLDTKALEVDFLRQKVLEEGGQPLVVDTGVLEEPRAAADIDRETVARAGGSTIADLIAAKDKARALVVMADGAARILQEYLARGELGGILSIGGSRGTALSTRVMQRLPVGVPKLMVSTIASGQNMFGPYVGTKDVTLMHSVADVQGVNTVTRPIFCNAAAAIVAMSRVGIPLRRGDKRVFSASMLGVTTDLVERIQALLDPQRNEVIAFHAVGSGGQAMEELIAAGLVDGVFDVTPGELTQEMVGGMFSAGPVRLTTAGRLGIPQVVAPGGVDFIICGALDSLSEAYRVRQIMPHTPTITLVRTSVEEMAAVGRRIAERLSTARGPAAMILPRQAFGRFAQEGQPLYNPQADQAFRQAFLSTVASRVEVVELDTHLNSPQVAETAVRLMQEMVKD
jgi:uncharacterized protein (UPF0261 family)